MEGRKSTIPNINQNDDPKSYEEFLTKTPCYMSKRDQRNEAETLVDFVRQEIFSYLASQKRINTPGRLPTKAEVTAYYIFQVCSETEKELILTSLKNNFRAISDINDDDNTTNLISDNDVKDQASFSNYLQKLSSSMTKDKYDKIENNIYDFVISKIPVPHMSTERLTKFNKEQLAFIFLRNYQDKVEAFLGKIDDKNSPLDNSLIFTFFKECEKECQTFLATIQEIEKHKWIGKSELIKTFEWLLRYLKEAQAAWTNRPTLSIYIADLSFPKTSKQDGKLEPYARESTLRQGAEVVGSVAVGLMAMFGSAETEVELQGPDSKPKWENGFTMKTDIPAENISFRIELPNSKRQSPQLTNADIKIFDKNNKEITIDEVIGSLDPKIQEAYKEIMKGKDKDSVEDKINALLAINFNQQPRYILLVDGKNPERVFQQGTSYGLDEERKGHLVLFSKLKGARFFSFYFDPKKYHPELAFRRHTPWTLQEMLEEMKRVQSIQLQEPIPQQKGVRGSSFSTK